VISPCSSHIFWSVRYIELPAMLNFGPSELNPLTIGELELITMQAPNLNWSATWQLGRKIMPDFLAFLIGSLFVLLSKWY
jgi:hypothetical protein